MKKGIPIAVTLAAALALVGATWTMAQQPRSGSKVAAAGPEGPCDIYAAAGDPCVAAYSTTRAMYAGYHGPLYQVKRQSDGKGLNVGVVEPVASPTPNPGGYADAAAQDAFCANTYCWIARIYDQSPEHNDLTQAPRGAFSGPAMGGLDNVPIADMAPVMVMGHKVYGVFIEPGMGLRNDDPKHTAVDDQAEGMYWVLNGQHFNSGCCFDFGNAEIDSRDDDNGTMETSYFGDAPWWFHGNPPGPWVMTDQENNLVGCANEDGSNLCKGLPNITWRFVTAIAEGEPHHWRSMGGNAQGGTLSVMFSGPRVNSSYDPMRKQGAIVLGNGGDNSNGSQGTFYEGAMTAPGAFPTAATEQSVQANIVAAKYQALPLSLGPASETTAPPGLQTFSPRSSQETTVTFTNTTTAPTVGLKLSLSVPGKQWRSVVAGGGKSSMTFARPIAPGASVKATFKVTSGPTASNGDLVASARWTNEKNGRKEFVTRVEKVRNVLPIRINEFRIDTSSPANPTNSFIELYNAGSRSVDISRWSLTERPDAQATFSAVKIPAGTKLAPRGFYLLGLSSSGLAAPARAGDTTLYVRSTAGMNAGDTILIGSGPGSETRKIAKVGTAAGNPTTLWQPLPEGPIVKIPVGSTNVPVTSASGFAAGEKIALAYGATYPTVPDPTERYELATVTMVGKPGTQDYLAADAPAGATNIKVTSVENVSVGDEIRLDVASVGHGIERVTVTKVGTPASRSWLAADASAGASKIKLGRVRDFTVGEKMTVGTPANWKTVTITAVGTPGPAGTGVAFTPALTQDYPMGERVVAQGTGLDLAAPLRFSHSANLPFSDRGTGISFQPATAFAHSSDEPVQPLGAGITLDRPLAKDHAIDAVVRDPSVETAGYQGTPPPDLWFGGPALSARSGSMVLRDAAGLVVDSLNYGLLVDPWAAEGYQAKSGLGEGGCYVTAPGPSSGAGVSAGRAEDGFDTDSNCTDFVASPVTLLSADSPAGATNIKVARVDGFDSGETIRIGNDANPETAVIAKVGTAGATTVRGATAVGATVIPVADARGFRPGQTIAIGGGESSETAVVVSANGYRGPTIQVDAPLTHAYPVGAEVAGTGITLTAPLSREYLKGAHVAGSAATPGAPNHYYRKPQ